MCIFCSLLGLGTSSAARAPVFTADPGSSASVIIGDGALGGSIVGAGRALGTPSVGTSGPGAPPIAAGAYDHTGNVFLDVLVGWGWLDVGGDRNITYYFDQASAYHQWSNFEKGTWRAAMQQWVNVANITSQEVSAPAGADIIETWTNSQTLTNQFGSAPNGFPWVAAHFLPHPEGGSLGEYNSAYVSNYFTQSGLASGGYGDWIFVHEIGHALGLSHPHGMVQLENEPLFPGVTEAGDLGEFGYNQEINTIMSYNRGQYMALTSNDYGLPATPMAFDIAAVQLLYGANTTFAAGADGYALPDDNATGTAWRCIWDTGGTDAIYYDGKRNATIDLRPATLAFGDPIAGGGISKADGIYGGYTIAKGVVIENAIGGSGNDTLIGNSADNTLDGRAGDDTAVYFSNRSSYAVQNLGDRIVVSGADGTDTLLSIEHVKFADVTLDLNSGKVQFDTHPAGWSLSAVGDLTGDGTSDLVWYNRVTGGVDLWKLSNSQWAGSLDLGSHPLGWQSAGTGDLNGDGTSDLLWHNPSTGNVDLWKIVNGQRASSVDLGTHPLGYQVAGTGDFDHDGTNDVLWYNSSNGATEIWKIVNGQWSATLGLGSHPLGWTPAGVGDFNHDGTSDIAWYNSTTGDIDIWQIVNGKWSASSDLGSHPAGSAPAGVGDFNRDGTSDIAWYNSSTREIDIWQIANGHWNGSSNIGSHPAGWTPAGIGDSNGDGASDIAWYNSAAGNADIWQIVNAHWAASVNAGFHPFG